MHNTAAQKRNVICYFSRVLLYKTLLLIYITEWHEIKGAKNEHSLRVIAKSGHKHTYLDLMVMQKRRISLHSMLYNILYICTGALIR